MTLHLKKQEEYFLEDLLKHTWISSLEIIGLRFVIKIE